MNNVTFEKVLTIILIIILVVLIYRHLKNKSSEKFENSYLPNYAVNVDCGGKVGRMVRGNNDIEFTSDDSSVSGSVSTDESYSAPALEEATESDGVEGETEGEEIKQEVLDKYQSAAILGDKNKRCILDQWGDDVFNFATNQACDCNRKAGCTVCDMKHSNSHEVVEKICKRRNTGSCIVDKMENSNFDYIRGLMLGSNVY